uniref:Uncharacterized protein n=1 Tax=Peromyscus maniculatus bairdii TaxID=230844 RepID=A0A8C8UC35_PERMB
SLLTSSASSFLADKLCSEPEGDSPGIRETVSLQIRFGHCLFQEALSFIPSTLPPSLPPL